MAFREVHCAFSVGESNVAAGEIVECMFHCKQPDCLGDFGDYASATTKSSGQRI
jgi:hypothetical protein